MKNINIKKVVAGAAALAVGASFLGAAVAAQVQAEGLEPIVKNDIIGANGMPTGTIVVGSLAQPIDVMWAGNIAAAIGAKAYTTTTTTTDPVVIPGTEGTTTVTGDGRLYNDMEMGKTLGWTNTLRNTQMPNLFDGDVEYYDYSDTKKTLKNVKESIKVNVDDVYFEKDKDTKEIIATIPARGITYTLDLGSTGVRVLDSVKDLDLLTVGGDHDVEIPFLGQMYKIRSLIGDKLTLVSNQDKMTYMQGSEFTLGNYNVKVSTITSGTPNRVLLELSQNGTVVKSESVRDGKSTTFGGLTDEITVTQVNYASDQQGYIEVSKGAGVLELENGEEIDSLTDAEGREWEVSWTPSGAGNEYLQTLIVQNVDGWNGLGDSDFPALTIGDSAIFPMDLGEVKFVGLKNETMYDFEVSNKKVKWSDKNYDFEIPLYVDKSFTAGTQTSMKFTVDNKEYYLIRGADNTTYTVSTTNDVADVINGSVWDGATYGNGPLTLADDKFFTITSDLTNSVKHYFVVIEEGSKMGIAVSQNLAGTGNGTIGDDAIWNFNDTDTTVDVDYYDAFTVSAKGEGLAEFEITDIDASGPETITFLMDTYLNRLADKDDFAGTNKVVYSGVAGFTLDDKESDDLREATTLSGAELKISSKNFISKFPEKAKAFEIFVGSDAEVTSGSSEGQTIPGTTYTTITPANIDVRNLVKMDNAGVGGVKIIVGGHLVNTLAQGITDDYLTQAGQWVLGKNTEGNMIVAGFTAQDTADAAGALISIIMG